MLDILSKMGSSSEFIRFCNLAADLGGPPIVEGIPGTTQGIGTSAYELRHCELVMPDIPGFGLILK